MPYEQHPGPATALNLIVRSDTLQPLALADTIRRTIARRNADVPARVTTMEGRLETATATPRFRTVLVVALASVALLLALAGVYGVMAYTVRRIPELGVRIALGATPATIMRLIVAQLAGVVALAVLLATCMARARARSGRSGHRAPVRMSQLPTPNFQLPTSNFQLPNKPFDQRCERRSNKGVGRFSPCCSDAVPWELAVGSWRLTPSTQRARAASRA